MFSILVRANSMFLFLVTSVAKLANWCVQDPLIMFWILIKLDMSFGEIGFGLEGTSGIFGSVRDWGDVWGSIVSRDSVSRILSRSLFVSGACWMFSSISSLLTCCKVAKLQARIKPTALCSAIDKENLIEFPLDFLHYLYNYYMVCALLSHTYHVTHHVISYDVTLWLPVIWLWLYDTCNMTLSYIPFCIVSPR